MKDRETPAAIPTAPSAAIPPEIATEMRRLAHDLSNALEIIVQTSYLLGTVELDANSKQWLELLDKGVHQATDLNRELRQYIRTHTQA